MSGELRKFSRVECAIRCGPQDLFPCVAHPCVRLCSVSKVFSMRKQTRKMAKDGRKPSVKISVGSQSSSRMSPFAYASIRAQMVTPYLMFIQNVSCE